MPTPMESPPLAQMLLAQGDWARRLARCLVQADQADDLVQEAFLMGLRRPPRHDTSPRGWLATVLRNLAQNSRLSAGRRRAREVQASAESAGTVPSADEALAQVQAHRMLARLVEKLPEEDRQIVVLRFFEDRHSEQIGAALGIPAGTVRWRLTGILAQLRTWLDEEHGGQRSRWMAVLAPLAGGRPPGVAGRLIPVLVGAGTLAAVAIVAVLVNDGGPGGSGRVTVGGREIAAPAGQPLALERGGGGRQAGSSPGVQALAVPSPACPSRLKLALIEQKALERDLRGFEEPGKYFDGAPLDEQTQQGMSGLLADLLEPGRGDMLECRALICRVTILRHPDADMTAERRALLERPWESRLQARLERIDGQPLGGISRDPLSGQLQQRFALYLYLQPPPLGGSGSGPSAAGVDEVACRQELAAVRARNEDLATRQERAVPPPVRFARATESNTVAETEVSGLLVRLLGTAASKLDVSCKRDVCRVRLNGAVEGDPNSSLAALDELTEPLRGNLEWSRRMRGGFAGPKGALFYRVREPRPVAPDAEAQQAAWKRFTAAVFTAVDRCSRTHPSSDRADATLLVPGPGELNADGIADRPSIRAYGPSAQGSFGQCIRREVTTVFESVPLHPGAERREMQLSFRGTRP